MQESKSDDLRPNFFQCPNILVDKFMAELSGSDLKCYLTIIRQTTGWHKKQDRISISQFVKFTGLSNRSVIDSCRRLVACGLIISSKDDEQNNHFMLSSGEDFTPHEKSSPNEKSSQGAMKKVHRGSEKSSQVGSEKSSHTKDTVTKETIQNTVLKESNSADAQKTKKVGLSDLIALGVEHQTASDWLEVRKVKRAALTQTALDLLINESAKAGITVDDAVKICAQNSWQGFKADWYKNLNKPVNKQEPISKHGGFGQRDYSVGINEDGSF